MDIKKYEYFTELLKQLHLAGSIAIENGLMLDYTPENMIREMLDEQDRYNALPKDQKEMYDQENKKILEQIQSITNEPEVKQMKKKVKTEKKPLLN